MNGIKVVIFDCDGVMFDTITANMEYYNHILAHLGKSPMTQEQFSYVQMHTVDKSLASLFKDKEELEKAEAYRKIMGYEQFIRYMKIEPYLKRLLSRLRPVYKTAIATNRTDSMKRVLTEFDLKKDFDLVVTALDVDRPKPFPDQLFKILNHFNADSSNALYVGDSELDETAAKSAGIPFTAYKNRSLSADFHITSLMEIENILDSVGIS